MGVGPCACVSSSRCVSSSSRRASVASISYRFGSVPSRRRVTRARALSLERLKSGASTRAWCLARALGPTRVDGIRETSRRGTASMTRETARRRADDDDGDDDDDDDGTTRFFEFRVIHESARSRARIGEIRTARGVVRTPGYVPVGTNAVIKAVHGSVLDDAGID